jgi:hypothetical protein
MRALLSAPYSRLLKSYAGTQRLHFRAPPADSSTLHNNGAAPVVVAGVLI